MAKDNSVTVTQIDELPGIPAAPKKRGRPATGNAKSNAQRQAAHRRRVSRKVIESIGSESDADSITLAARVAQYVKALEAGTDSPGALHCLRAALAELNARYCNAK